MITTNPNYVSRYRPRFNPELIPIEEDKQAEYNASIYFHVNHKAIMDFRVEINIKHLADLTAFIKSRIANIVTLKYTLII